MRRKYGGLKIIFENFKNSRQKRLQFLKKYSNINRRLKITPMQRCLSGLRSTIGNRVMRERIRRFKSSSLRQQKRNDFYRFFFVYVSNLQKEKRGFSTLFLFILRFYASLIAPTGHPSSQAPQSTHSSVTT